MNIYVETNFVLELTFKQEQYASCEEILQLCEAGQANLVIPAYSLAEPHEKLIRQARSRKQLQQSLNAELGQLKRTASYASRIESIKQDIESLLVDSNEEEQKRFIQFRDRLLNIGDIVALTADILIKAASCEDTYDLTPQDAFVYASVIDHLQRYPPQQACFLNRDKGFANPDIVDELNQFNCRMIFRFDCGYRFLQSQLSS
ncbi:DUF4935 domain-containing protein [Microcoleus sp. FACHB-SPT15]|uniref:PIN domain-containing protein n=1 Tax=Microcoleus sp. FACHB-SPT15 TaxID=2692830 RepID=UPI00177D0A06|nr:PIN domain-containing protein [Microcoleus sp. FACHB-SPT15]MBD1804341.1 DUF4935 domain-containing protein [Microcoleus sp. FACHB-SPT15]